MYVCVRLRSSSNRGRFSTSSSRIEILKGFVNRSLPILRVLFFLSRCCVADWSSANRAWRVIRFQCASVCLSSSLISSLMFFSPIFFFVSWYLRVFVKMYGVLCMYGVYVCMCVCMSMSMYV